MTTREKLQKMIEELEQAISYADHHGKDGRWSYELLQEKCSSVLQSLNELVENS